MKMQLIVRRRAFMIFIFLIKRMMSMKKLF